MAERDNGRIPEKDKRPASPGNQISSIVDSNRKTTGPAEVSIARIVRTEREDPMGEEEAKKAWQNFVDNMNA